MSELLANALEPLDLGQIKPAGWLKNQLRIQADGLTGHLDEFWPDIRDSGWIGGPAEGWERAPYWLDGLVPLAYLLDDPKLTGKAMRWMDHILTHQHADGWLGPVTDKMEGRRQYDPWPRFVLLKVFTQYFEATGDQRVIPAMTRFLTFLDGLLDREPLASWGRFRWQDLGLSIQWLYDRTGEAWLLDLAQKVQKQGYDWRGCFDNYRYGWKNDKAKLQWMKENWGDGHMMATHVVNNAMAIKAAGVAYRQGTATERPIRQAQDRLRDEAAKGDRDAIYHAIDTLDLHHGQVTGLFSGDEHLATRHPSQGTELCAVVEYMFSLEVLVSILGDVKLADRLESIAFNALPAACSPDMWSHQYDQQANQVQCGVFEDRIYTNNSADANVFGLEPNFGCCTANMHQGWPKFASHLWMKTPDGGLAAVAYAPCIVETIIGGVEVSVEVETDYPFGDEIAITVAVEDETEFPIDLRIPAWAEGATVTITESAASESAARHSPSPATPGQGRGEGRVTGATGGLSASASVATAGQFHRISRRWQGTTRILLKLPMSVRAERRSNDSVAIWRGPLVYSLLIGEQWRQIKGNLPHADWEVMPTTPWNYALAIDASRPQQSLHFQAGQVGPAPFSPDGAPCWIKADGRRVPGWTLQHNAADAPPRSPVTSADPLEELTLIPYGCTNLRVTEFPVL